jgi:hypothetical protein
MEKKLIIVAGVSSAGKSTLIDNFILPKLKADGINVADDVDIRFAGKLLQNFELGNKPVCIVHYNLLLQFDTNPHLTQIDLSSEPVFCQLLDSAYTSSIYLCYTPDEILRNRIATRTENEPIIAPDDTPYPSTIILNNFEKVDQRSLTLDFGEKFKSLADTVQVVFSTNENSTVISWEDFKYAIPSQALEEAIT